MEAYSAGRILTNHMDNNQEDLILDKYIQYINDPEYDYWNSQFDYDFGPDITGRQILEVLFDSRGLSHPRCKELAYASHLRELRTLTDEQLEQKWISYKTPGRFSSGPRISKERQLTRRGGDMKNYTLSTYPHTLPLDYLEFLIMQEQKQNLEPWQERLLTEFDDLAEKIYNLTVFITSEDFDQLDEHQQLLLRTQRMCMMGYLDVLDERLELAGIEH